jgi:flagellar hook-associated protein 2
MGISSLGVGSSILTQDVLDQLRDADEAGQIKPITLSIANEGDKKDALDLIDASMTNFVDSINAIKSQSLYDERQTEVSGTAVEVSADANSDIQDFTLSVTTLATKQIEESGAFGSEDDKVATEAGTMKLNIDGLNFEIAYDEETSLKDLKKLINDTAGEKVDATIVQISSGEFRLFMSSVDTGTTQNITITDNSGFLSDDGGTTAGGTKLTTDMTAIQTGINSEFTFNGQAIERTSNDIDDLIAGLDITLKETGTSVVSVSQNRENIMEKIDSFVTKYNSAITELDKMTKPSVESEEKGIFSGESTIKNMKRAIEDMFSQVGGGVGTMGDYGFDIDKDGKMTLDKNTFNNQLDDNPKNVEAFFSGGSFVNSDGTTTEVDGVFTEMSETVEGYTKYNATLDLFATSIDDNIKSLEERKTNATERLDAKYEIMKKQFAAYDLMISKFNSASSMFSQMVTAENAANS